MIAMISRRRGDGVQQSVGLFRGDELLEPRVVAERVEGRVDLQPAGREVVRDLQQRLELVERLLRLAGENVDSRELVLHVWTLDSILRHRLERGASQTLPDRFVPAAQIRERQ